MSHNALLERVVGVLVLAIIMLSLTPVIISFTETGVNSSLDNLSSSAKTIVSLVPLFWVLAILGITVAIIYTSFKHHE